MQRLARLVGSTTLFQTPLSGSSNIILLRHNGDLSSINKMLQDLFFHLERSEKLSITYRIDAELNCLCKTGWKIGVQKSHFIFFR